jgi:hypothetical protein
MKKEYHRRDSFPKGHRPGEYFEYFIISASSALSAVNL